MRLGELLPREHIIAPVEAQTLMQVIDALLQRLATLGVVHEPNALAAGLAGPRARDIVCIGPRVALPHYRTDAVDRLTLALAISPTPVASEILAPEASPQVVVLILAPSDCTAQYLQIVSALARLFKDESIVDQLIAAADADHVLDITRAAELRLLPRLTVRDIMSQDVRPVRPDTSLREAVDLMVRKRLRAVPVIGDKEEVLGVVSERDLVRGLMPRIPRAGQSAEPDGQGDSLTVRDVMTRSVMCVPEDLGLEEVANLMINKDVEQLPVTSDGKLVGFLTRSDLIRKLFAR